MGENLIDFAAGSIGGFAGKLLDYPFDTVKVLLQTQSVGGRSSSTTATATSAKSAKNVASAAVTAAGTTPSSSAATASPTVVYRGAWHCLRYTVETHGFMSLYRGLSSPLLGSMAENAVLFLAYNEIKRQMGEVQGENDLSLLELSLAGAGAGAFVPFVLTPFEVVKCRLQVQNASSAGTAGGFRLYKGPIDVVIQTIKTEGFSKGLYRGNTATLMREIPGNFCWYGVYEGVCKLMIPDGGTKSDLGTSAHLLGGAMAGVAYWTAFYPADTVKSLVQTSPDHAGRSFIDTFRSVYLVDGIRGLYRGWAITAARAAPAHALIFATYEYAMKFLQPDNDRNSNASFTMKESIRD